MYTWDVSIHAPRVGRDGLMCTLVYTKGVSIHAPRVGRDGLHVSRPHRGRSFNPRAPCGARQQGYVSRVTPNPVSIHAPRVGRDCK